MSIKNLKQVYRGNELCISVNKGGEGGLQQAALQRMLTQEKYIIEAHTDALSKISPNSKKYHFLT